MSVFLLFIFGLAQVYEGIGFTFSAQQAEEHDADQVAQELIRQHNDLRAISLKYHSVNRVKGELDGYSWNRSLSVDGTGMFRVENSHLSKESISDFDTTRKTMLVTPTEAELYNHVNRFVTNLDPTSGDALYSVQKELIFELLCWWPYENLPAPKYQDLDYVLPSLLRDRRYRISEEKSLINGTLCFGFVVNDSLTLWCDCDHPGRVVRSDRYVSASQALDSRFEFMDFEQFSTDIWLPTKFRVIRFDSYAHLPELRDRIVYDNTFVVSDIKVNTEVVSSDFHLNYAPGTVREVRSSSGVRYQPVTDGQLDHFMSIVHWCRMGVSVPSVSDPSKQNSLTAFIFCFFVGCGLVALLSRLSNSQILHPAEEILADAVQARVSKFDSASTNAQ